MTASMAGSRRRSTPNAIEATHGKQWTARERPADEKQLPMSTTTPIAKVSDIPDGSTQRVTISGRDILLCNVNGAVYAVEDVCTHDGGALDAGELEGCRIMCPRHGAYFDVTTGAAITLPAILPLSTYSVRVNGDDIYVDV
jgi:3-phenylpropionate/trans-cinnamate dioxygenase ferredoxin subunit